MEIKKITADANDLRVVLADEDVLQKAPRQPRRHRRGDEDLFGSSATTDSSKSVLGHSRANVWGRTSAFLMTEIE